jgi:hypothetical protein
MICKALNPKTRPASQQLLAGAGDLELVMKKAEFDQEARFTTPNSTPRLIINGVNLEDSATLIATFVCDPYVYLRFRIAPKKGSEKLWSAIYNSSELTGKEPLVPAIGWDGGAVRSHSTRLRATDARSRLVLRPACGSRSSLWRWCWY